MIQSEGMIWSYRALMALFKSRNTINNTNSELILTNKLNKISNFVREALYGAGQALYLAKKTARIHYPVPHDFVRAHWLMGAAQCTVGNHDAAQQELDEALAQCRAINLVEFEADILLDTARLAAARGDAEGALPLAEEALLIAERSGYVLQLADIHCFFAAQALARADRNTARHHATTARRYAHCEDGPPWHYKVAYDEAEALLARIDEGND